MPDFEAVRRLVAESELFKGLSANHLGHMLVAGRVRSHAVGEEVFRLGDKPATTFFLILAGSAEVISPRTGESEATLEAGEVLGEVACALADKTRTRTVLAGPGLVVLEWDFTALGQDVHEALVPRIEARAFSRLAQSLG